MITRSFPQAAGSVPLARHFVLDVISGAPEVIADRAALIVSELVTNAIRHAETDFEIRVKMTDEEIFVEIADSGGGVPTLRVAKPLDPSGRGLQIVEALADTWGVHPAPNDKGKTVWFTLSLTVSESES